MIGRLRVSPFGAVEELPTCPYCGRELGWWAVPNMEHHRNCAENPTNIAKRKAFIEKAIKDLNP